MRRIGKRLIVTCVSLSMILQSFAPATNALAATINAAAEAGAYSTTDDAAPETGGDASDETGAAKDDTEAASPDAGENAGEDTSGADQVTDDAEGSQEEAAVAEGAAADESEAEAQAQGEYLYNTLDELTADKVLSGTVEKNGTEITTLTTSNLASDLKVLSNAAPALYKNANIVASQTSDAIDLTDGFNGLGGFDENDAFAGTIALSGGDAIRIKVNRPLFNGLKVAGERKYLIEWATGDSQEAVLAKRVFGSENAIADVTVYGVSGSTEKLTAPIIATLRGNLTAKVTLHQNTMTSVSITSSTNSIGIVAGTVESGALTIGGLDMPGVKAVTVDASGNANPDPKNGNAGMLVGRVADGAGLMIDADITAPSGDIKSVTGKDNASAGAVVGKLGTGDGGTATPVVVNKSIDVSALTVTGAISGGFVGRAGNVSLAFGDDASITPAKKMEATQASGGLFGRATLTADLEITPSTLVMPNNGIEVSGINAGGLFGVLISRGGRLVAHSASMESPLKLKVTAKNVASNSNSKGVGGVIGMLDQAQSVAKVDLTNVDVDLTSDGSSYVGGMIGNCWGSSVVNSGGVSVVAAVSNCTAFGGVVGVTRANSAYPVTVLVDNLKVATAKGKPIVNGGGVVGRVNCKALVRLSGTTDLSEVCYEGSEDSGQITSQITSLDNRYSGFAGPLVFATGSGNDEGWTFIRGKNKSGDGYPELDDIGGYGEVIRLDGKKLKKDFLTVDESTGTLKIKDSNKSATAISSVEDFARLAITWETNGVFKGVSDNNWSSMKVTLDGNIDLTGTGIYSFSREGVGGDTPFTGSIDGGGHSITLSIGEAYGTWDGTSKVGDNDEGNGRIYRHKQLGLFAAGNGSASNLTIDGTINVDAKVDGVAVGAFAATCTSSTDLSFNNVVCKTTMNIKANNKISVGGFIGKATTNKQLTFTGGSSFAGNINMSNVVKTETYIGGAIGYIDDASMPVITVDNMKLSGSITAQTNNAKLCAGGLIGFIDQAKDDSKTKTVTISGLDLGDLKLDFSATGNASATGGYLGSTWAQTNVAIQGSGSAYAIKAPKSASLKTGSAKYVGGLVYHAGGVWTVNSKAIDFNNVGIESKASELGLLVCRGGRGKETGISNGEMGGLYLNVTKRWDGVVSFDGIKLTGAEPAAMDEWVADTRGYSDNNVGDIFASGKNGVVSLTTVNDTVVMDGDGTRNTYENQTEWGKKHPENGNTRYYYNLNKVVDDVDKQSSDNTVDTPEELLLWSVRHYVDSALQAEFNKGDAVCETIMGTLNMKGYSYYPVDIANCSVNINNATITFWNKQIETLESGTAKNKLTSEASQHQAMHCGLIRNYSSSGNQGGQTLSVKMLTLSGTVGPMGTNGGSGALICGTAWGEAAATTTVSLEGITLKNLAVTNFAANTNKSLPLLVNAGGSHLSLSVNDLSCDGYTAVGESNTVASSLMGNMGGEDKTGINLSFSNISIPSYKDERIFSSALLMMSFGYKTDGSGSASYNFTAEDEKVTYGQEIDGTTEYGNNDGDTQYWYFDAEHVGGNLVQDKGHNTTASTDKNKPSFGAQGNLLSSAPYLKYVANGHDDSNPWRHEVAVNHSAAKLIAGCGTYTDPYVISSAKNLRDAANIIQGANASGSEVNITVNQDIACSGENGHGKFVSNGSTWVCGDTSYTTEAVSRYLRSAYYIIDGNVTVSTKDFSGLGQTPERAFRGVIVGKKSATLTIRNDNDSKKQFMGLIPYSYGSVVKDLKVRYGGDALSIGYEAPKDQVPQAFFGGVMGCVLGGDNIVDGVTVSAADGFSVDGVNKNMPIGGYVGVVAGGGVLFRNMSENSWHTAGDSLYDNAFLGRMLNGYAFSEGCTVDNGERNYKINKINEPSGGEPISTNSLVSASEKNDTPYSVSVSSNEGLLVLSGIINSGAAAGYGTKAYDGTPGEQEDLKLGNALYGKVRNAQYNQVGETLDATSPEWLAAKQDDQSAPSAGNTAYLVTTYADASTGNICASDTAYVEFNLNGTSFDMTKYSTGYLGLSARYVSNAGIDRSGTSQPMSVMPSVAAVKGSSEASAGTTLHVKLDVQEYKTDDYHLLGVGGLFGVANFRTPGKTGDGKYTFDPDSYSIISNLTIGESNISLSYADVGGTSTVPDLNIVGVGGVAGVLATSDPKYKDPKYMGGQITNFAASDLTIKSPSSAGSLFGYAGAANLSADGQYLMKKEFELTSMTMRLVNCGFSNLNITADRDAGGFFGYLVTKGGSKSGVWNTEETTYGANSSIVSTGKLLNGSKSIGTGGFVGHAKGSFWINEPDWGNRAVIGISALTVANRSAFSSFDDNFKTGTGGLLGLFENPNSCRIHAVTLSSSVSLSGAYNVGGLIGKNHDSSGKAANIIDSVRVDSIELSAQQEYLGGFVGCIYKSGPLRISNSTVAGVAFNSKNSGAVVGYSATGDVETSITNCRFENNSINGTVSGSLVGFLSGNLFGTNVLISSNTFVANARGLLVGFAVDNKNTNPTVRIAGLDYQLGKDQVDSGLEIASNNPSGKDGKGFLGRSFVAYADYNDKAGDSSVTSGAFEAEAADPYATTSPYATTLSNSELSVVASDGSSKALFGDSMNPSTAKIIQEEKDSKDAGKFHYASAPSVGFSNTVSTMALNNDGATLTNDFDVLQVSSGNEQVITDYLDTVTNGGYSKAKDLGYVTASAKTYAYDDASKQLVAPEDGTAAASMKQALEVTGSGSSLGYSVTSGYDNGLMRITLLTVKIGYAKDKGYYVLHVPIVVRRMLEVDFTATLTGGTVFNKTAYANLGKDAHVLESYGSSMTGLLTYTYNSAVGERMEYGWDSYLADGGSMGATNKTLVFASSGEANGNYPVGTQLTLLDCAHNNKEYHYKVETEGGISSISLSEFKDAAGKGYEQLWLSDVMGVTAERNDASGKWVKTDEASATASGKLDDEVAYFRPATSDDAGEWHYRLTVEKGSDNKEQSPSEEFYLVVRFPKDDTATAAAVVGKLKSNLSFAEGTSIATRVNQVLRPKYDNKVVKDDMANTASTYSILTGYKQELTDNDATAGPSVPALTGSGHTVQLDVTDTVTFNSSQVYNGENDPLYYELSTTLGQWAAGDKSVGSGGFPSGMSGAVTFYAQVGDMYYVYSKDSGWKMPETSGSDLAPSGLSYGWASDGGEMKLLLGSSNEKSNAVSLAGLRDAAKKTGHTSFTIRVQMTIEMADEAFTKAIAASSDAGMDNWTQMVFRGQLATKADQLEYTSLTSKIIGNHKYYREGSAYSTISLTASLPSQLGINIDDLRQATADGTIGTVATYDLSNASNVDELLNKARSVTFTVTLKRRVGTDGSYDDADITKVMSGGDKPRSSSTALGPATKGAQSYSWTDTKKADGTFYTQNGQKFELPIDFVVDTTKDAQVYANYRIVVTAEMRDASGDVINTPGNTSDFVTFTLTRVNTKGIQ